MQCKEPSACLIHTFRDKVSRIYFTVIQNIFILEWIMNLRIRHSTGIKPDINQVRFALHRLAVFRYQNDIVYIRTMKIYLIIIFFGIFTRYKTFILVRIGFHKSGSYRFFDFIIKFFYGFDTYFARSIFCTPDRQWSTPITGTA